MVLLRWPKAPRRLEPGRLELSLGRAVTTTIVSVALGLTLILCIGWLTFGRPPTPKISTTSDWFDALKVGLAIAAGVGAAIGIAVSYRRQSLEEKRHGLEVSQDYQSRFTSASEQLGHEKAAVRLAGVHSMARLADDWVEQRQTCVSVLCAYICLPYEPGAQTGDDQQVRRAIFSSIRDRLRLNSQARWPGVHFDFTGATIDNADLSNIRLDGCTFSFVRSRIMQGAVSFVESDLSHGQIVFRGATFANARLSFVKSTLHRATLSFAGSTMMRSHLAFGDAEVGIQATVDFEAVRLLSGSMIFDRVRLTGGIIRLADLQVEDGAITFDGFLGTAGLVDFPSAALHGGVLSFAGAQFHGAKMQLLNCRISGATVSLAGAKLDRASIQVADLTISEGTLLVRRTDDGVGLTISSTTGEPLFID